jgi:hypothetical protein
MSGPLRDEMPAALVVIPGTGHYLHDVEGQRLSECLTSLGFAVERTPPSIPVSRRYALCCICSPHDVFDSLNNPDKAAATLGALRGRSEVMLGFTWEPAALPHFRRCWDLGRDLGWDALVDLGMHPQERRLLPPMQKTCRFLRDGLTPSERRQVQTFPSSGERSLPWVCVGSVAPHRAALVDYLVREVHPGGAVYLTCRTPGRDETGGTLGQAAFEKLLRGARFQVWCSQHLSFHLEPARFRMSLLAGCVPVKVLLAPSSEIDTAPCSYLLTEMEGLPSLLDPRQHRALWQRLRADYLAQPPLAEGLAELLETFGLTVRAAPKPAEAWNVAFRLAA